MINNKPLLLLLISLILYAPAKGQTIKDDFKPVCDSLSILIKERTTVSEDLKLKAVMKRKDHLDFYFTESLGDFPWHKNDAKWFRSTLKSLFPEKYRKYRLGETYTKRISLERLETNELTFKGNPSEMKHRIEVRSDKAPLVRKSQDLHFSKGLSGRNIALWQSHGRYYDQRSERWRWQRPCLFQTCEDMFTQSFVLPYLVPMIENSGGYVLMPRERDIQTHEVITDNDKVYTGEGGRIAGTYEESGKWTDAGVGFADTKPFYTGTENPFTSGTARQTGCIAADDRKASSKIIWRAEIPERGEYAVYVSYKSLPKSTSAASYTVHHFGGQTNFIVNQKIGGGMWIYLGTFEFDKGSKGYVTLDNRTPKDIDFEKGSIVTADAVRFGGGMGNIARSSKDKTDEPVISGMSRYAEAARYWLQWAGADPSIFSQNEEADDYRDDFMSRGDWVAWLSEGSSMNPGKEGKGIPIDLSLGFHSDAGVTPNDSIVGTLAIYTLKSEGVQKLPSGDNRMTSREFASLVQDQIVNDIRCQWDSLWSQRQIWDRGYRESRTPTCPSMLLELLSHQNFADMKYGLDPTFQFTVGRAVYKGMLKYLSNRYGVHYAVQPLPVEDISVSIADDGRNGRHRAELRWRKRTDPIEPTAEPEGYILQTRIDDGAFNNGKLIERTEIKNGLITTQVEIIPGRIYSFRITAYNSGGKSFPSETVSTGIPESTDKHDRKVLIVNNFDRISGPTFFDTPEYAGFDNRTDSGVPYIKDISFIGDMYQNRRDMEWLSDDNPGFGASFNNMAGTQTAGNTFDYAYIHGRALMDEGYPFCSCSNEAFCNDSTLMKEAWTTDLICGKQVTVLTGNSSERFSVFTPQIQSAIRKYTSAGGNVIVSGAYIATDIWDKVYPVKKDDEQKKSSIEFAQKVLGYKWQCNFGGREGKVTPYGNWMEEKRSVSFCNFRNPACYCVEAPDGIAPASSSSKTVLRYSDTSVSAGIAYRGNGYSTVCLGFPIETLMDKDDIRAIMAASLKFLESR